MLSPYLRLQVIAIVDGMVNVHEHSLDTLFAIDVHGNEGYHVKVGDLRTHVCCKLRIS